MLHAVLGAFVMCLVVVAVCCFWCLYLECCVTWFAVGFAVVFAVAVSACLQLFI